MTRRLPCWIDAYAEYAEGTASPKVFRLWTALATVGLALERRVWVYTARQTFANLFVFLVGKPGVGKSVALEPALELLRLAKDFKILPKDLTGSALLDVLERETYRKRIKNGTDIELQYHSAGMFVSEVGTMLREYDKPFLSIMSDIWDCPADYEQERRGRRDQPIRIPHPQLSILAGATPGYMASILPTESWTQGFMARVIMVHSAEKVKPKLFDKVKFDEKLRADLVHDLGCMSKMYGEYIFDEDAKAALDTWYDRDMPPVPTHHKLEGYNGRRIVNLQKLCIIARASRGHPGMLIEMQDFQRALEWMLDAESAMPNVFMEMAGRSDYDVIRELHFQMWNHYVSTGKKPIHVSRLNAFLSTKVPAYQATKILELSISSEIFKRVAGSPDLYIPQAVHIPKEA